MTELPSCLVALDPADLQSGGLKIRSVIPKAADATSGIVGTIHVTGLDVDEPARISLTSGHPGRGHVDSRCHDDSLHHSPGSPGTVDVALQTPSGTAIASKAFTFLAPASISSVNPAECIPGGDTAGSILGSGLAGAVQVGIGPVLAVMTGPPSDDEIRFELPDLEAGVFDVSVLLPTDGRSSRRGLSRARPGALQYWRSARIADPWRAALSHG